MKRTQVEARAILRLEQRVREVWGDEQTRQDIAAVLGLLRRMDESYRCPECHCAKGHKMDCSRGRR